ncbi:MAG: SufE family protein [Bacteroidia bacterium]|nr:SufE family protein [Bacteroidia bacterium]
MFMDKIWENQQALLANLNLFDEWEDKYQYIIELGEALPPLEEQYKVDDNLVQGCQSRLWVVASSNDHQINFLRIVKAPFRKDWQQYLSRFFPVLSPRKSFRPNPLF